METKQCSKCEEVKPLDQFHRMKATKDGLRPNCKMCVKAYSSGYYAENKTAVLDQQHGYREANPHVSWEVNVRQRSERLGFEPTIESFTKEDVIERYGSACFHCGGPFEELDHHPVAIARGGSHCLSNVVPSCIRCNRAGAGVRRLAKPDVGKTA